MLTGSAGLRGIRGRFRCSAVLVACVASHQSAGIEEAWVSRDLELAVDEEAAARHDVLAFGQAAQHRKEITGARPENHLARSFDLEPVSAIYELEVARFTEAMRRREEVDLRPRRACAEEARIEGGFRNEPDTDLTDKIARDRLTRFAELEKSPEYVHFYRITPVSIWNAAALGERAEDVVDWLVANARFPVAAPVLAQVREWFRRYGLLRLTALPDGDGTRLQLVCPDAGILATLAAHPSLQDLLDLDDYLGDLLAFSGRGE